MTALVVRANARQLPLADDTVDLVVTSPPYFALRSYQDGGEHYAGQIGDEPTPAEFVASLLEVTTECIRVLKPSGSLWVNLGDKYARAGGGGKGSSDGHTGRAARPSSALPPGLRDKSLIGIPWRYALACIDDLGLILRSEVIWDKPNGLPESVTDRVRRSHEQWFHFTLQPRYFSAVDEIREAHIGGQRGLAATFARPNPSHDLVPGQGYTQHRADRGRRNEGGAPLGADGQQRFGPDGSQHTDAHPLGKLPGSVWRIPTEPLSVPAELGVDHFAAFPTEWPKRIIQGWSPTGICTACGEGRRPVSVRELDDTRTPARRNTYVPAVTEAGNGNNGSGSDLWGQWTRTRITGYACACPTPDAPTRPAVVLDPFGGTGTTAMVAHALGRTGISVDMSQDYSRIGKWRTNDRNQLAKALGVAKAPAPDAAQLDLF